MSYSRFSILSTFRCATLPMLGLLGLAALAAGCGRMGDPLPPLRSTPQRTDDLSIRQEGRLILLEMSYPRATSSGMAIPAIEAVELWELVSPVVEGAAPAPVDSTELEGAGGVLLTVRGDELAAAQTGDRVQIRVPLADPLPDEALAHHFAVTTLYAGERSVLSNLVTLVPVEPPTPPGALRAEARVDGVELAWESGDAEGFEVYRRSAQERGYGEPLARIGGGERGYLDKSARYGDRYIYTVRVATQVSPPIVSAPSGEREIHFLDRFAPPLPADFVGLGERGQARLRWDASAAPDVAGYILFRREPGRDFHRLREELVTGEEFVDTGLASGLSYDYKIQVIDGEGNTSEISEPITVTVR